MMKKQPAITEKTRQSFVTAFWALMREKPVSKIAVSELTRVAGYNRSTFYEYFLDTEDLLAYAEEQLLEQMKRVIAQIPPKDNSPEAAFGAVFAAMNEEMYLLIGPNGDPSFLSRVRQELVPLIRTYFSIPENVPNFDYLICYVNAALFGLLQHWNRNGRDLSMEQFSGLMQNLVLHGLLGSTAEAEETS
ncbi:MAG: TetR/AcrR family transcriptional regulator [Firmicutes bacterium]|nr:TetR/AcrR family transcriptional regulator [Bacillota bacterium]